MTPTVCTNLTRKDRDCQLRPCFSTIFSDSGKKAGRRACNGTLCRYAFIIYLAISMPSQSGMRRLLTIDLLTDNNYSYSIVWRSQICNTFTVICAQVVIYNHYRALQTSCLLEARRGVFAGITVVHYSEVSFEFRKPQFSGLKIATCWSQSAAPVGRWSILPVKLNR